MSYDVLTIAIAALAGLGIVTLAALRGWQGWLAFKTRELDKPFDRHNRDCTDKPSPAARIELADLKERVRQLEAIASGVDL